MKFLILRGLIPSSKKYSEDEHIGEKGKVVDNMSEKLETGHTGASQQFIEKRLLFCTAGLILYHMLLSSFNSAVPNRGAFRNADKWFGLILLLSFLIFVTIRLFAAGNKRAWIKECSKIFRAYEYWFLFVLAFWYVVSCMMHKHMTGRNAFKANDWWLYITWLMSFAVFPFAHLTGVKRSKAYIDRILKVLLITHVVFFSWLLWNYFHKYYVRFPSGNALAFLDGIGLAAGENRNFTAATALAMMGLCWYMIFSQKSFRKVPYIIGLAVYLAVLILTNSRTSWYVSLVMTALIAFRSTWYWFRKKDQLVRIVAGITCVVVCMVAMHFLRGGVFELWDRSVNYSGNYPPPASELTGWQNTRDDVTQPVFLTYRFSTGDDAEEDQQVKTNSASSSKLLSGSLDRVSDSENRLSGRKEIYKACIKMMFSRKYIFLFGVTHADVGNIIMGEPGIAHVYYSAHNFWLQMGLAFGVPMMLASIVFTLFLVLRCLRVLFREKEPFAGSWMAAVIVLSIFVFELAETQISAGSLVVCPAFYVFAGWVVAMDMEWKEQNKTELTESVHA